jgi:uncharacterized protein involved in type VI secretion and phage assembly
MTLAMYTVSMEAGEAVCKQAHKYSTLQLVVVAQLFALVSHPEQQQEQEQESFSSKQQFVRSRQYYVVSKI